MTIDLDKYRSMNIKNIEKILESRPEISISELTLATNIPIIAICHFYGELKGFNTALLEQIERLKKFYNIKEVVGIL